MKKGMKSKKQTISAVIAVKNEEAIIGKCLDAVKDWTDEIVIIDNGSNDNTKKICEKYTSKIYEHNMRELIPFLQNIGIQKATKDWVLILDADVIVPKAAAAEIVERINTELYDGYYLPHKSYIMGKFMESSFWTFQILKLFKRSAGYFPGKSAHESLAFTGKAGFIKEPLLHYSHPLLEMEVRKLNLYSSQDAEQLYTGQKGGLLKRKIKKVGIYSVLIQPMLYFIYLFFYRRGYKDKVHGFIVDCNMAFYVFLEAAKVLEAQQKSLQSK